MTLPTPTTAVERSDKNRAVSVITIIQNKTNSLIADWDNQLLDTIAHEFTRCRSDVLQEVEGLELMQDESENKEDHYTERSRAMAVACNLLRKDLRTQLTLLKGKK